MIALAIVLVLSCIISECFRQRAITLRRWAKEEAEYTPILHVDLADPYAAILYMGDPRWRNGVYYALTERRSDLEFQARLRSRIEADREILRRLT